MVNVILSSYNESVMGDIMISPEKGNVCFGSGKEAWAFSLTNFAGFYAKKFNIDKEKLVNKLWGDNYFNPETKKWLKPDEIEDKNPKIQRSFCSFILEPIIKLCRTVMDGEKDQMNKILKTLEINLKQEESLKQGKELLKLIMSKWLNAADALLEMMIVHLPSPLTAQKYRAEYLYEGPIDDEFSTGIRNCDINAPLMMFVSKMVPNLDNSRFYAFGRVFSGKISTGQKVVIMGPDYNPNNKKGENSFVKNIQKTVVMMGKNVELINDVPCGNIVGLLGVDQFITKTGTISDSHEAHTIRKMKYSVSPVVRVAVQPKEAKDLPKLIEGLRKLSKSDPLVQCIFSDTGENIIAGCGELHVEICLHDLQKMYTQNVEIITSEPVVAYKETVIKKSSKLCLAKTANNHNRLYCQAEPLDNLLVENIEKGLIGPKDDIKLRASILTQEFKWSKNEAYKIWSFGPENNGPNMLIDMTQGINYMNEIKDSLNSAFQWTTSEGILCNENARQIRVNIMEANLHADSIHRGGGQMIACARNVFLASQLTATPRLQEPIFLCEITVPNESVGSVYKCISQRRGIVVDEEQIYGTPMVILKAYLPVQESFGN